MISRLTIMSVAAALNAVLHVYLLLRVVREWHPRVMLAEIAAR